MLEQIDINNKMQEQKKRKINSKYKNSLFEDEEELSDAENEDNEVEKYLAVAQIPKDQDSLKWWNANQKVSNFSSNC